MDLCMQLTNKEDMIYSWLNDIRSQDDTFKGRLNFSSDRDLLAVLEGVSSSVGKNWNKY